MTFSITDVKGRPNALLLLITRLEIHVVEQKNTLKSSTSVFEVTGKQLNKKKILFILMTEDENSKTQEKNCTL